MSEEEKKSNGKTPEAEEGETLAIGDESEAAAREDDERGDPQAEAPQEGDDAAQQALADEEEETEEATLESLQEEVQRLRQEADEYLDGWQRARAELINYKKRMERERENMRARIASQILARYLDVLDDLERAMKDSPTEGETATWAEGIELIRQKLKSILEAEGVEPIQAEGETFDPNLHEAISYEESEEFEDGQVIEVVKQGYKLGDIVVRPAIVRVAK